MQMNKERKLPIKNNLREKPENEANKLISNKRNTSKNNKRNKCRV